MQSAVRPVSSGPRFTLYFSAPGFNAGVRATASAAGAAPRPRPPPPKAYTPEKSGFPSAVCGIAAFAVAASLELVTATGVVPATVTVIERVTGAVFGGRIVNVYVVVAAGLSCLLPRGVTEPRPGSIVSPAGFSVLQTSRTESPGLIEAGRASKVMMRAGGAGSAARPP